METMILTRELIFDAYHNDCAATCVALGQRWLDDHPNDLGVLTCYANMLYKMGRYEHAVQLYEFALEFFPEALHLICMEFGALYRYRGEFQRAAEWFQKGIDARPEDAGGYIFLGAVQARLGQLDSAEDTHRRATECKTGCIKEAFHNLGLVLRGQGAWDEAERCFVRALEFDPDYFELAKPWRM